MGVVSSTAIVNVIVMVPNLECQMMIPPLVVAVQGVLESTVDNGVT